MLETFFLLQCLPWTADSEVANSTPTRNLKKKYWFFFAISSLNNYKNWLAGINLHAQM